MSVKGFSFDGGTTVEKYDYTELDNKPSIPTVDGTLSVSGAAADAKAVGDEITDLKADINELPEIKDSTETDIDLDVSDVNGNVILRLEDGHIETKEFNSATVLEVLSGKQNQLTFDDTPISGSSNPVKSGGIYSALQNAKSDVQVKSSSEAGVTLDVSDVNGNVIARFAEGNVQTKFFNSDNGIYESRFSYTGVSGTETIERSFPAGTRLAFHLTKYEQRNTDTIASYKVTYKYTDTNSIAHVLGIDYGYNFPEYALPEDAVSVSVAYGSNLNWGENATLSFKVYSMASFLRNPTILNVGVEKEYTSLRQALEYATQHADAINKFEIHIYPGIYDTLSDFTTEEIEEEGFQGIFLTNGVSLIGIGQGSEIILTASMDTEDYTITKRNDVSTLNVCGNCTIKNITIKAENIRYAVHDDTGAMTHQNNVHCFEEVTFYGKNLTSGGNGQRSYGAGGGNMKRLYFRNCDFSDAMVIHTTTAMTHEYTAYLENCRSRMMVFSDYDSSKKAHFYLKNCDVSLIVIESSGTHEQYLQLEGEGTCHAMVKSPQGYVYAISGVKKYFDSDVSAGMCVKLNSTMTGISVADSLSTVFGISIGVKNGATYVQTEGWINSSTIGLSNLSVGDYLTIDISTGALVSGGTSSNAIAQVKHIDNDGIAYAKILI